MEVNNKASGLSVKVVFLQEIKQLPKAMSKRKKMDLAFIASNVMRKLIGRIADIYYKAEVCDARNDQ